MGFRSVLLMIFVSSCGAVQAGTLVRPAECLRAVSIEQRISICTTAIVSFEELGEQGLAAMAVLDKRFMPALAALYETRGTALLESGDPVRARIDLDKAIAANPAQRYAYLSRGKIEFAARNFERSIVDLSRAIELTNDATPHEAYNWRAWAWIGGRDPKRAIADFSKAIDLKPEYADAYFGRGTARELLGETASAIIDYRTALGFDRGHRQSRVALQRLGVTP